MGERPLFWGLFPPVAKGVIPFEFEAGGLRNV